MDAELDAPTGPRRLTPVVLDNENAIDKPPVTFDQDSQPDWVAQRGRVGGPQELVKPFTGSPVAKDVQLTIGTSAAIPVEPETLIETPTRTPPMHAQTSNDPMAEANTNVAVGGPAKT